MASEPRPAPEERRPAVRFAVDLGALYAIAGTPPRLEARITEISASGLRLRTSQRLALGMRIDVVFEFSNRSGGARICVRARVVRVVVEGPPVYECGLMVIDDAGVKNALRQLVLKIDLSSRLQPRKY
jgi:hypothetical protein